MAAWQFARRHLWMALGWAALGLGVLGVLVPLLPTTPFLILAAYLFSRGSERLHAWLLNHRIFGPPIENWRTHRAISTKAKARSAGRHGTDTGDFSGGRCPRVDVGRSSRHSDRRGRLPADPADASRTVHLKEP